MRVPDDGEQASIPGELVYALFRAEALPAVVRDSPVLYLQRIEKVLQAVSDPSVETLVLPEGLMSVEYEELAFLVSQDKPFARNFVAEVRHVVQVCQIVVADYAEQPAASVKCPKERVETVPSFNNRSPRETLQLFHVAVQYHCRVVVEVALCEHFAKHFAVVQKVVGPAPVPHVKIAENDDAAFIIYPEFIG